MNLQTGKIIIKSVNILIETNLERDQSVTAARASAAAAKTDRKTLF